MYAQFRAEKECNMCESNIGTEVGSIATFILLHKEQGNCDICLEWIGRGSNENPVITAIARLEQILEDPRQSEREKVHAEHILVKLMRNEDESVCLDYVDASYAVLVSSLHPLSAETRNAIASFEAEPENEITVEILRAQRQVK